MKLLSKACSAGTLLVLMGLAFSSPSGSCQVSGETGTPPIISKTSVTAFKPGEKLVYKIKYGWFVAGEAVFKVDSTLQQYKGRQCYHFSGFGRTLAAFELFYKVRDNFDTYVDADRMLPLRYVRVSREGDFKFDDEVTFDQANNRIHGVKGNFKTTGITQDVVSALYYARCLKLSSAEIGKTHALTVFLDDKVYPLGLKVIGREVLKVGTGTYNCLKISPMVVSGRVFQSQDDMVIWVTDDDNYIPIRVESKLVVGSIHADLVEFTGLRNPMRSKLN